MAFDPFRKDMKVTYWLGRQRVERSLSDWKPYSAALLQTPPPGAVEVSAYACPPDINGVSALLWLAPASEMNYWKLTIVNQGRLPVDIEQIDLMDDIETIPRENDLAFYTNGWQSWSQAGTYLKKSAMPVSILGALQRPMIENPGTPAYRRAGLFSSDFYGAVINRKKRSALLAGFLSQMQHFGTFTADLRGMPRLRLWANGDHTRLEPGKVMDTDWAVLLEVSQVDQPDPFGPYLDACAAWHNVKLPERIPVGWCSWYHYYQKVTDADIRANLQALAGLKDRLPVDLLQIDDGFEAQVGDWFSPHPRRFPEGVTGLAAEIRQAGLQPGLWLAPFIVHPKSMLAKNHPDWLLRRADGKLARAGWVWNALGLALDLTNPEALEYSRRTIHTAAHEWGYPYLKLDFLYAAALQCRYQDPTQTRAQVLRHGMQTLRDAAGPDTFLLGCGAPFGSCLGLVEGMRIGADVSGDYHPNIYTVQALIKNEPSVPCLRNGIRNTLNRAALHRRWWLNDPDCLITRPNTHLTAEEVRSWATLIYLSGGMLLISDDMPRLPPERLQIFEKLLPLVGKRPWVLDGLDKTLPSRLRVDLEEGHSLLAIFNWEETPQAYWVNIVSYKLTPGVYAARNLWTDEQSELDTKGTLYTLPPHGCLAFEVQLVDDRRGF